MTTSQSENLVQNSHLDINKIRLHLKSTSTDQVVQPDTWIELQIHEDIENVYVLQIQEDHNELEVQEDVENVYVLLIQEDKN